MSQQTQNNGGNTTQTKIFVGGLAWETKSGGLIRFFEQYGEVVEANVVCEKPTGRSKGYGFVTFRDADSAQRACQDPTPIIVGRQTNCNLAHLGSRRNNHSNGDGSGAMGLVYAPSYAPSYLPHQPYVEYISPYSPY